MDAQVDHDAQLQAQLQAEEEANIAAKPHPAKKKADQVTAKELEAARHAFADFGTKQELASDDDEQQRSVLLARKVVSEEATQAEAEHNRAEREITYGRTIRFVSERSGDFERHRER